ncbi:hypothetical protein MPSEU_001058000 [Mayamaea pseudoterrestris]|nr:hypothetical protein MPSEU_001058000 [Mayamaea pseudoterrestris]
MNSSLFAHPFATPAATATTRQRTQQSGASFYSGSSKSQGNHDPFRGKRHRLLGNSFMKQAMRVVLLSPLVVLAIWSVLISSKSQQSQTAPVATSTATRSHAASSTSKIRNNNHRIHSQQHANNNNNNRLKRLEHGAQEHLLNVVEVLGEALGEEEPVYLVANALQATENAASPIRMEPARGAAGAGLIVQPNYVALEEPLQQAAVAVQQSEASIALPSQSAQSLQAEEPILARAEGEEPLMQQPAAAMGAEQPGLLVASAAAEADTPALARSQPDKVTYLYYDPRQLHTNSQGQVVLPDELYDNEGRVISTTALVQQASRKVYIEPPALQQKKGKRIVRSSTRAMETPLQLLAANVASPPVLAAADEVIAQVETPPQLSAASNASFTKPQDGYDQSILVSTVGIMALLVGAVSARRLRSRSNWLQVCIENESLEDDAAYDDAHTVVGESSDYGTYNTFGWKGDLEKFDV